MFAIPVPGHVYREYTLDDYYNCFGALPEQEFKSMHKAGRTGALLRHPVTENSALSKFSALDSLARCSDMQ